MGKLLLCSDSNDFERISSLFTDFTVSASDSGLFGQYATYRKLRVPTKNCFCAGEEFAIGVGTFVYNGKRDADALEEILRDWKDDYSLRENIIGSYCIGVYKKDIFTLFVDEEATYKVYYYLDPKANRFAVTTTLYHLAKGLQLKVDDLGFLGDLFLCNIGENTICPEIHRLSANCALCCQNGRWSIEPVPISARQLNGNFCDYLRQKYKGLDRVFPKTATFLTGGQDSRITLALMLSLGMKPTCLYGVGDSTVTNTKSEDLQCVREIAKRNGLSVQLMNWADSDSENKETYLKKYVELFSIYGMNKNFFSEFESQIQENFVTFGYLGETFRAVETIQAYPRDVFTLSQYVDEIYLPDWMPVIRKSAFPAFRKHIYHQYLVFCQSLKMDTEHLTKDEFQTLNSIYRLNWDLKLNQLANLFCYSFPLFADRTALEHINRVPYQQKINSKFQMECIEGFWPQLLSIPFFSHIKPKKYNPATHELTETTVSVRLKDKVKCLVKNPVLYRMCRYMYYVLRGDGKGLKEIRKLYQGLQNNQELFSGKDVCRLITEDISSIPVREAEDFLLHDFMRQSIEGKDAFKKS